MKKPSLDAFAPDVPDLIEACQNYLDYIESPRYNSDKEYDYIHAVFEVALCAVFGKDVFDFVNEKSDERDRKYKADRDARTLAEAKKLLESAGISVEVKK